MRVNKNITAEKKIRHFIITVAAVSVIIIVCVTVLLSFLIMKNAKETMHKQVSELVASNSKQLQLNINSYLNRVQDNAARLFSEEEVYSYVPLSDGFDDEEKVNSEAYIFNRIMDISVFENYSDFFVVYSNDDYVGIISDVTKNSYSADGLYKSFVQYIVNTGSNDGWGFGKYAVYDRLYYVKRLNDNGIIVVSFYTHELNSAFEIPDRFSDMSVQLTDENNRILYASDHSLIGSDIVDEDILFLMGTGEKVISDEDNFININNCNNGWKVICKVPSSALLKDVYSLQFTIVVIAVSSAALATLIMIFLIRWMLKPMDGLVSNLENKAFYDQLSKVLNKQSFKDNVTSMLAMSEGKSSYIFCMFDVDNFKQINDNLGHNHGDQFISRMGALLNSSFKGDNILIGRLGGDEFAVFIAEPRMSDSVLINKMSKKLDGFLSTFANVFWEESSKLNVSVSIGVTYTGDYRMQFDTLYHQADEALYKSKNGGKNQYNFYDGGKWDE